MPGKKNTEDTCESLSQCAVQALVGVDDRGQMVLPKDVRTRAGIAGGDKLALTTIEKDGEICCIVLTKAGSLGRVVQETLADAAQSLADQE